MSIRLFRIVLFCLFVSVHSIHADVVDRSVAVVNEEVITLSEVNELGKPLFQQVAEQVPASQLTEALQQARKTVIDKLIDKKLLVQEAKKLQISVSDEDVDAAIQRILERNQTSISQFRKELAAMGMDEQQYREELKEQILSSKLINYEVRSKVIIPEDEIIDYYDTHYTEQVGEEGYYLLQMGFTFDKEDETSDLEGAQQETRKRAERVRRLAVTGGDFKALARQYSDLPSAVDGGDIGVFQAEEMAASMRDAVTKLKPGETSELIETAAGYQIFKLLSSQEGQIITKEPYEAVKESIRETLYQEKMQENYQTWLETIREQAYIKIL